MTIPSQGTLNFWELYRDLPFEVRKLARRVYRRWQDDAFHPSLHFKKVGNENWSVRVGLNYRAIGQFVDDGTFLWDWIGTHAEYDKRV